MSKNRHSVLIVDDQQNWRDLLSDLLKYTNQFDVENAETYHDALNRIELRNIPYSVVITDVRLVDEDRLNEDGLRLIEKLNNMKGSTKTIVVTGYPSHEIARKLLKLDAYDYFEKYPSDGSYFKKEDFVKSVCQAASDVDREKNCFVIMPFRKEFDEIFECIREMVEANGMCCRRADDTSKPGIVIEDIIEGINSAKVIIADVTEKNPNVYFEIGLSHAIPRNVILITQNIATLSESLGILRCIPYRNTVGGAKDLANALIDAIREIQRENKTIFEPGGTVRPSSSCAILMPDVTQGESNIYDIIKPIIRTRFKNVNFVMSQTNGQENKLRKWWQQIESALLVITDLSGMDVDVFYLSGFAYGLRKKQIFIISKDDNVPFDLRAYKVVPYSRDISDLRRFQSELRNATQNILPNLQKKRLISILFLAAEPNEQARLQLAKEFREIQKEILESPNHEHLKPELPQLSLRSRDISARLLQTKAQIVHFSGHGGSGGQLYFERDDGTAQPIEPNILAELFKQFSGKVKCVILNACYSEKQAKAIAQHIDYVIGMRQSISDEAAIKFSIGFYQALGAGKGIEEAFEFGKIQAGMENAAEYETPVLHKRRP